MAILKAPFKKKMVLSDNVFYKSLQTGIPNICSQTPKKAKQSKKSKE